VDWAKTIGPATADLLDRIMASKRHPEQGYRSCLGILRLSKQYTSQRVEAAARRAIALHLSSLSRYCSASANQRCCSGIELQSGCGKRSLIRHRFIQTW
jgi:hypothetical protein